MFDEGISLDMAYSSQILANHPQGRTYWKYYSKELKPATIQDSPSYNAALYKIYSRGKQAAKNNGESPEVVKAVGLEAYAHARALYRRVFG
jgi:hypothetical protein